MAIAAASFGLAACGSDGNGPSDVEANSLDGGKWAVTTMEPYQGNNQAGPAGTVLPEMLVVRAWRDGQLLVDEPLRWDASGGGTVEVIDKKTDANGLGRARVTLGDQPGGQNVWVRARGGSLGTFAVTVVEEAPTAVSVALNSGDVSLEVGDTVRISASATDANGKTVDKAPDWRSSDASIATIDGQGLIRAVAAGATDVTATVDQASASLRVTVTAPEVPEPEPAVPGKVEDLRVVSTTSTSVTLAWTQVDDGTGNPARSSIRSGSPTLDWGSAAETAKYLAGTQVGATQQYTWTDLAPGTRYEFRLLSYRRTTDGTTVFGGLSNVVAGTTSETSSSAPTVARVIAQPASVLLTALGAAAQLSAAAYDASGGQVDAGLTWASLRPDVADVSSSGRLTAVRSGSTGIVVTAGCCNVADTVEVTVNQQASRIVITPASLSIQEGQSAGLNASVVDENGFPVPGASITWSSSDPAVIEVNSSGTVTGRAAGTASAIATSGVLRGAVTVVVSPAASEPPVTPSAANVVLDWNYRDRDDLRNDPSAQVSDEYVDGANGPIAREQIVDVSGAPWSGPAKALRVNYDGTGDNDGRVGGEQYGGSVRFIPGVVGDGRGGAAEPRHVWIRTWAYLAPNFDGWGWKMLHLRSPTGTRTEVKPYRDSLHPVIDNNSSMQTAYVGRNVAQDRGQWIEILIERKLASPGQSDGIFRVRWAGQMAADYVNVAPVRDSETVGGFTAFLQNIAFGRNTGPTQPTYVMWGPAEVYFTNPGWSW